MKILFLGPVSPGQTSLMRMRAFQRLGHEVVGVDTVKPWTTATWFRRQWQRRLRRGSVVNEINRSVFTAAEAFRPDLVWAEKQEYLTADTLQRLKRTSGRLAHFTPDPYFTLAWKRTPLMDEAMRHFDILVYCKRYEEQEYRKMGALAVYMPLGFCDETHRPLVSADPRWRCDIGFLGGWEPRREEMLHRVAETGFNLKIWGGYWDFLRDGRWTLRRQIILGQLAGQDPYKIRARPVLAKALQGDEVYGDQYAMALTGAKIGVGFLRKVCPDQHTTRTFEIPATGSLLLADRTDEHREFFTEGSEAEFFSAEEELIDKVRFYVGNESARLKLAAGGLARCHKGGYSYIRRLEAVLGKIDHLLH